MKPHYLDWGNQPDVYKHYPGVEPIPLPRDSRLPEEDLQSVMLGQAMGYGAGAVDMERLSGLLLLTYSLTAKARHPGGDFYYRSVASAGALYPTEIYVATLGVKGLHDGLYHFSVARHGLTPLRTGDLASVTAISTDASREGSPVLVFFLSAIFFRSSWKYRDRSYRYHLLDTGHVLENLVLALKASGLSFELSCDFDDRRINLLLGLDEAKEACLVVLRVTCPKRQNLKGIEEIDQLPYDIKAASTVAPVETSYPAVLEVHQAGMTVKPFEDSQVKMLHGLGLSPTTWSSIASSAPWPSTLRYAESALRRRSSRNYVPKPLSRDCIISLLDGLCVVPSKAGTREFCYEECFCTGFLVGNAQGLDPGLYLLDRDSRSFGQVRVGSHMADLARICLDQSWLAHAAVHFLFMTNLEALENRWGARGYRYAMIAAGRLGERLYVLATSMGLGCCGIGAFYDDEAAGIIGLNPPSRLLYLVAVGPVKAQVDRRG